MIEVILVPEDVALETARTVITALGERDPLARRWIVALRKFGLVYQGIWDGKPTFSRPV